MRLFNIIDWLINLINVANLCYVQESWFPVLVWTAKSRVSCTKHKSIAVRPARAGLRIGTINGYVINGDGKQRWSELLLQTVPPLIGPILTNPHPLTPPFSVFPRWWWIVVTGRSSPWWRVCACCQLMTSTGTTSGKLGCPVLWWWAGLMGRQSSCCCRRRREWSQSAPPWPSPHLPLILTPRRATPTTTTLSGPQMRAGCDRSPIPS